MSEHTRYLEITKPEDLEHIEAELRRMIETADLTRDPDDKRQVTIQLTVDLELIAGLLGWVYAFWIFGKRYFFPEGKFRKPKLLEFARNFQIVTGILTLKNTLIGLWKDRNKTLNDIGAVLKKLLPKTENQ